MEQDTQTQNGHFQHKINKYTWRQTTNMVQTVCADIRVG